MVEPRAILISGAASGIGLASARALERIGFLIYAGVLPGEDTNELTRGTKNITVVPLDITKPEMIQVAYERISREVGEAGLYGLFNNAGVGFSGAIEMIPLEAFRKLFEVNMFGHVAMTQTFIPLVRKAKGRIVNTTSVYGKLVTPMVAPYVMSKHAMEAFTDVLRLEMQWFDVQVSAIEPGIIKTPIWQRGKEASQELLDEAPTPVRELYEARSKAGSESTDRAVARLGSPPEKVAAAVIDAFTSSRPRTRYVVGADGKVLTFLRWLLPDRTFDFVMEKFLS